MQTGYKQLDDITDPPLTSIGPGGDYNNNLDETDVDSFKIGFDCTDACWVMAILITVGIWVVPISHILDFIAGAF